jgi:hypothetical protein
MPPTMIYTALVSIGKVVEDATYKRTVEDSYRTCIPPSFSEMQEIWVVEYLTPDTVRIETRFKQSDAHPTIFCLRNSGNISADADLWAKTC